MKKKGGKGKYINSVFTAAIQPLFHVVPPPPLPRGSQQIVGTHTEI